MVARALTVSGASEAAGVSRTGTPSAPARSDAARASGKFSPDASTTVDAPPGKLAAAARRAVSYLFAPPTRPVVTPPAGDAVKTTASPEIAIAPAAMPATRDFENRFTEVLKGIPPGRWLRGPGGTPANYYNRGRQQLVTGSARSNADSRSRVGTLAAVAEP